MNTFIKILLSLLLVALGYYTVQNPQIANLFPLTKLNLIIGLSSVLIFFVAVAFYCLALQRLMNQIDPHCRTREPRAVWYMYLLPYNFIEDFFIIFDIVSSLRNQAQIDQRLIKFGDFGLTLGIGWCLAQLLSFIPNIVGQIAGVIGVFLWIAHWMLMAKIYKFLKTTPTV